MFESNPPTFQELVTKAGFDDSVFKTKLLNPIKLLELEDLYSRENLFLTLIEGGRWYNVKKTPKMLEPSLSFRCSVPAPLVPLAMLMYVFSGTYRDEIWKYIFLTALGRYPVRKLRLVVDTAVYLSFTKILLMYHLEASAGVISLKEVHETSDIEWDMDTNTLVGLKRLEAVP